jgi:ABC-type glycerol-3-phosphate transport system substrate-binding protein
MSYGAKYFENGIAAVDNDGIRNGLLLIEDMVKKGYQGTSNSLQANFAGGQGAFMFHSQALSIGKMNIDASYAREYPNGVDESVFDVVTFPIINEENPCIGAGIAGYALSSTTKNRDVAWQFLKFMLTKQGQNIIAEKGKTNYPPIRKDMSDVNDETNLWTKGYSNFNLEAYLWAAENDALCMTDFILEAPQYATDLISAIQTLISDYVVVEDPIDEAISSCNKKLNYWLNN